MDVVDVVDAVGAVDVVVVDAAVAEDAVVVVVAAGAGAGIAVVVAAVGWGGEMLASDAEVEQGNSSLGPFAASVVHVASAAWYWSGLEHLVHLCYSAAAVEYREFDLASPCTC